MKKEESKVIIPIESVENLIYIIRGHKVMLDKDLAILYGIETKKLNQALKRNPDRFPEDFSFQLKQNEWDFLRSQIVTLDKEEVNRKGKHTKYLPHVFTEQGVAMLSSVLRSPQAVAVNIEIMRAFVRMRHIMTSQQKMSKELEEVKSFLLKHTQKSDQEFRKVWVAIEKLSNPANERKIGFKLN